MCSGSRASSAGSGVSPDSTYGGPRTTSWHIQAPNAKKRRAILETVRQCQRDAEAEKCFLNFGEGDLGPSLAGREISCMDGYYRRPCLAAILIVYGSIMRKSAPSQETAAPEMKLQQHGNRNPHDRATVRVLFRNNITAY